MSGEGDIVEKLFKAELRYVNKHLPLQRRPLSELVEDPAPCVPLRDGGRHCFKKRELRELSRILAPEEQRALLLPIIVQVRRGARETEAVVEGRLEASVVEKLLGQNLGARERGSITLYPLQLAELISRHTTIFQTTLAPRALSEEPSETERLRDERGDFENPL